VSGIIVGSSANQSKVSNQAGSGGFSCSFSRQLSCPHCDRYKFAEPYRYRQDPRGATLGGWQWAINKKRATPGRGHVDFKGRGLLMTYGLASERT